MGSLVGVCGEGPLRDWSGSMMSAMSGRVAGEPRIDEAQGCGLGTQTRGVGPAHLQGGEDGDLVIAGDARIDTRRELAKELGLSGQAGVEAVVAGGWRRWGHGLWGKLRGDFAIAIWERSRRRLVAARDPFGVRPLFYHERGGKLAFGSEIKAILALPWVERRLNEERARLYLENRHDGWETFYAGIHRLPPGRVLEWDDGKLTIDRYWRWSDVKENKKAEMEESARELRRLLDQAVARRLEGRTNACFFLSGGWDSSTLVTLAARQGFAARARMETGTFVFDDVPECDEREYARAVREACGLEGFEIDGSKLSPLDGLEEALAHQDEPWMGPNLFLHDAIYAEAQRRGFDCVVDGIDGDTVISHGKAQLGSLLRSGRWGALVRELHALCGRGATDVRRGLRSALGSLIPDWLWERRQVGADRTCRIFNPIRRGSPLRRAPREEHAHHVWMMEHEVVPLALETADRAACRKGLETLYPFMDVDVARHALGLPGDLKLAHGRTRAVLGRAMADLLPRAVAKRTAKSNLAPNFNRGLGSRRRARLEQLARLATEHLGEFGTLRIQGIQPENRDWLGLWLAMLTGLWLAEKRL